MSGLDVRKLCFSCMSPLEAEVQVCPLCGYDNRVRSNKSHQLPFSQVGGRYLIGRAMGQGGFGITYIGYDLSLRRKVAIKEYFPREIVSRASAQSTLVQPQSEEDEAPFAHGRARFLEEAQLLARLSDVENVVHVTDFFMANGTAYIVMDYVQGPTIKQAVTTAGGKLPVEETVWLLLPLIRSLQKIHNEDFIHRDISPDNIIIRDSDGRAVLIDFGAARKYSLGEVKDYSIYLKQGFAPIEQYSKAGDQGAPTDVYALCATMYFMLTGVVPAQSLERSLHLDELKPPASLNPAISPGLEAVLLKGMAVEAKDRYATMDALATALEEALSSAKEPSGSGKKLVELMHQTHSAIGTLSQKMQVAVKSRLEATATSSASGQEAPLEEDFETIAQDEVEAAKANAKEKTGQSSPGTSGQSGEKEAAEKRGAFVTEAAKGTGTTDSQPSGNATPLPKLRFGAVWIALLLLALVDYLSFADKTYTHFPSLVFPAILFSTLVAWMLVSSLWEMRFKVLAETYKTPKKGYYILGWCLLSLAAGYGLLAALEPMFVGWNLYIPAKVTIFMVSYAGILYTAVQLVVWVIARNKAGVGHDSSAGKFTAAALWGNRGDLFLLASALVLCIVAIVNISLPGDMLILAAALLTLALIGWLLQWVCLSAVSKAQEQGRTKVFSRLWYMLAIAMGLFVIYCFIDSTITGRVLRSLPATGLWSGDMPITLNPFLATLTLHLFHNAFQRWSALRKRV